MSTKLQQQVSKSETVIGFMLQFPVAGIIECACKGYDWIWIDSQHGQHDYRSILECIRVTDACGMAPIVRVPSHEPGSIGRVLDMNPAGIMVPMINSADQAKAVVEAMYFPPLGQRSFGGRRAVDMQGLGYHKTANDETLLLAQIETKEAVGNAEAIAATPGVDILFFGADDMKLSFGLAIDTPIKDSKELTTVMQKIITAAKNTGKAAGCVASTPESIKAAASMGYSCIVGASDIATLRTTVAGKLDDLRKALEE